MNGLIIVKLLLTNKPWCISSEYKMSQCPSIADATIRHQIIEIYIALLTPKRKAAYRVIPALLYSLTTTPKFVSVIHL